MRRCSRSSAISEEPTFRKIEPLGDQHKALRAAFSCGSELLDRYLKELASQDVKRRAAAPYILVSKDNHIAGYYTLSSDSIRADDLPPGMVQQLNFPRYPVIGATLIGRLARDLAFKGKGVGDLLLADALKRSLESSQQIASAAVIVDAKDAKAHRFYADFGFIAFPESTKRLFLPMQTVEKLYPASVPAEPV